MKAQKKLLCWIYGLCFVIVWLFPGKALSQTNWPKEVCQIGYNMETLNSPAEYYNRDYKYLPVEFFPWGVCLNGNTTALEDAWTEYAVNKWNEDYIKKKCGKVLILTGYLASFLQYLAMIQSIILFMLEKKI